MINNVKIFLKYFYYTATVGCRSKLEHSIGQNIKAYFWNYFWHINVFTARSTVVACCQSDTFSLLYLHIEVNEIPRQDYSFVPNKFRFANEMTYVMSRVVLNQRSWVCAMWVEGITSTNGDNNVFGGPVLFSLFKEYQLLW